MWDAQQLYNTRFHQECQQFFQYFFVLFAEIILGSFFRAKCPSLPASPLGRGGIASAMTERASLFPKSIRTALCIGFCQSDTIAAPVIFRQRPCPLRRFAPRPGCGTQRLLRCRLHPAGRCPNSSSLFPPLAAVVAVAPSRGASGEEGKLCGMPRPPLDRGGVSASALTERFSFPPPSHAGYLTK